MEKKINVKLMVVIFFVLLLAAYIPVFMSEGIINAFVREDRIYETLSPIYLFVTSMMFAFAFYRSPVKFSFKDPAWIKRISFLGLSLLFLLATMEEISWGQRFFGIETPDLIKGINFQKELNFHNLKIFQGEDAILPLDFDQLSALFALTLGFLIPAACYFLKPLKQFLITKFPILPVQFSLLYLVNYVVQKYMILILPNYPNLYHHPTMKIPVAVHEAREHNYAMLLMVSAIFYILLKLDLENKEQT